jgi:hypothetical protein
MTPRPRVYVTVSPTSGLPLVTTAIRLSHSHAIRLSHSHEDVTRGLDGTADIARVALHRWRLPDGRG